jgi:hypothetical protein
LRTGRGHRKGDDRIAAARVISIATDLRVLDRSIDVEG